MSPRSSGNGRRARERRKASSITTSTEYVRGARLAEARLNECQANVRSQHPLVPADPWRRPLSRHHAPAGARSISPISRQIAQAADQLGYFGVLLPTGRSCEDSWVVASSAGAVHRAAALSRRGAARAAVAGGRGADDGDARPDLRRAAADQRRHRRRSRREQGRRHLPRP